MFTTDLLRKRYGSVDNNGGKIVHNHDKNVHIRRNASFITKNMLQTQEVFPAAASMITAVFQLEKPLDISTVQKIVKEKFVPYDPRLSSVLVHEDGKVAWKEVEVNYNRHVKNVQLNDVSDMSELQNFITMLYKDPMDTTYPLWYFYVISGKHGSKGALVCQIHHCIGDGVSTVALWTTIFDPKPESKCEVYAMKKKTVENALHPAVIGHRVFVFVKGVILSLSFLMYPSDTKTCLKLPAPQKLHKERIVGFSNRIPLSKFSSIGNLAGATVNEVFVAVMSASIRRYLQQHDPKVFEGKRRVKLHGVLPLSVRKYNEIQLSNKFVFYPIEFPVHLNDKIQMLKWSKQASNDMKISPEAPIFMGTQRLACAVLPFWVINYIQQLIMGKFTIAFTNVPGTTTAQYLAGVKVENISGCVSAPLGVLFMLSSYDNTITLSICADPAIVPEPNELIQYFEEEVEEFHKIYEEKREISQEFVAPRYYYETTLLLLMAIMIALMVYWSILL